MKTRILLLLLATISLMVSNVLSVYAQDEDIDEFTLEEITVTILKRESVVQDTPMSITAIPGVTLRQQGKTTLQEIMEDITGVSIRGDTHGAKFFIRGATENLTWTAEQPTATYTDGIYVGAPGESRGGFYDIKRLEVARGPQGTLYGFNALGGSVNIISNDPDLDAYEAKGNLEIGNFSLVKTDGVVNVPLGKTFAVRGAFVVEDRDGYLSNGENDSVMESGRIKFLYRPISIPFQMILSSDVTETGGQGRGSGGPWDPATQPDVADLPDPWLSDYPGAGENINYQRTIRASARFTYDLDFGSLYYQASYSDFETKMDHWMWGRFHTQQNEMSTHTQELRMTSPDNSDFIWTVGASYWKKEAPVVFFDEITPQNDSMTKGVFGQVTYPVTDRVRVTGGLRYSRDTNERARYLEEDPEGTYTKVDAAYDATTWKIGVEMNAASESLLYATASTGYRTGGFSAARGTLTPYGPQEMLAYQIGSKNRFLNDSLQVNGELFLYQYKSYQLRWGETDEVTGSYINHIVNSSDVEFWGAEVEISYLMSKKDKLNLSIANLQTDLGEIEPGGGLEELSHHESDHSPQWTLNLSYEHRWDFENGGNLYFKCNSRYESEQWLRIQQDNGSLESDYHKSNASLIYNLPNGKWSVQGYVRNIENYPVRTHYAPGFDGAPGHYNIQAPRTWGVIVSVAY